MFFGRVRRHSADPILWARDCIGPLENPVYAVSESITDAILTVSVSNTIDCETVTLTNSGVHFRGLIRMTRNDPVAGDGVLSVRNGIRNCVRYPGDPVSLTAEFLWALEGWSLPVKKPDLESVVVYPNPVPSGRDTSLIVGNLPEDCDVFLTDPAGNIIRRLLSGSTGSCEFTLTFKSGIYTVAVRNRSERVFRRVLAK
jgi:hypothetical protein